MLRSSPDSPLMKGEVREPVTLERRDNNMYGPTYHVIFRGQKVGRIEKAMFNHDRPLSRGSRIVGRRTWSTRWVARESGRGRLGIWYDTRLDAAASLVRDYLDKDDDA